MKPCMLLPSMAMETRRKKQTFCSFCFALERLKGRDECLRTSGSTSALDCTNINKEDVPRFPKIIRRCRECSGGGVDTAGPQRRLVDYVTICVCVCVSVVTPFSIFLSLSRLLCISQAHATDYIMRPHPCTAVEQNKGTLPAETQQPTLTRRAHCLFMTDRYTEWYAIM